ncbi:hypothetical protein MKX08_002106 [Trichoderma sp. CBMAI-0020]|nr:hypothetical protein MKX08_002106 [Trichoderma sp. CBMAI-0020]
MPIQQLITNFFNSRVNTDSSGEEKSAATVPSASRDMGRRAVKSSNAPVRARVDAMGSSTKDGATATVPSVSRAMGRRTSKASKASVRASTAKQVATPAGLISRPQTGQAKGINADFHDKSSSSTSQKIPFPQTESSQRTLWSGGVVISSINELVTSAESAPKALSKRTWFADSDDESSNPASKRTLSKMESTERTSGSGSMVDPVRESALRYPKPALKTLSHKTEPTQVARVIPNSAFKNADGCESDLELDTSKSFIDETMISVTSFAMTPAKEADTSVPPHPTPSSIGPQRLRRSAFAAAKASIQRSYEVYGQPLVDSAEAAKSSGRALAHVTGSTGSPAASASSYSSVVKEDCEAELPVFYNKDAATFYSGNASDGDCDQVSQCATETGGELEYEPFLHDEPHAASDSIDHIHLIADDEYIAVEDEDDDDDHAPLDDDAEDDDDASEPLRKKPRVVSADVNAAKWLAEYNALHPVEPDDEDLLRFDGNLAYIIKRCCRWATEGNISAWYKLPRVEREMTLSFHFIFRKAAVNPDNLIQIILDGMPLQARKVLGKKDLSPLDLLDLPVIPRKFKHRLVYLDIAIRLAQDKIRNVQRGSRFLKEAMSPTDLQQALQVKLYVGSSVNALGGHTRIRAHVSTANGHRKVKRLGLHYGEITQADVVPNFRMFGVWQNPYADGSLDEQNTAAWVAPMVEGMMIVYLGLYTKKHLVKDLRAIFPLASYGLVNQLRAAIALPAFTDNSLNRAWPLCQAQEMRGGGFRRDPMDGNARCGPCHRKWTVFGRQYEFGVKLPRLTKAQRDARTCSRPGCSHNRATWGTLHRWKDFVADGWVCDPCFKELLIEQRNSLRAADPATAGDQDEDAVTRSEDAAEGNAVVQSTTTSL